MCSEGFPVSSLKCGASNVECKVSSVKCWVSDVECRVSDVECRVRLSPTLHICPLKSTGGRTSFGLEHNVLLERTHQFGQIKIYVKHSTVV